MAFFKKKPNPPESATFKQRVESFWNWWSENSERILYSVNEDGGASIQQEVIEQVNQLGSAFAWVFGPHPDGSEHGHSFTLSPEGDRNHLFLTSYWLSQAPTQLGWHFDSSRQPSSAESLKGASIRIGDLQLKANELWLTATVDTDAEELDLVAWSPIFTEVEESTAHQVLFLLLDEALGENAVSQWLGRIEIKDDQTDHSFPLTELAEQVSDAKKKHGWEDVPCEDSYTGYSFKEPRKEFPRSDLLTLTTKNPKVTIAHYDAHGRLEDPISDTGASYQYISIPISQFPKGKEVDLRAEWEDLLEERLTQGNSGQVLGGGLGLDYAYIDVLIFDGERSLRIIGDTLDQSEARKFKIHPFGG